MSRNARTYDHFCVLARALEQVGDWWTLLVVRDLLGAPADSPISWHCSVASRPRR